MRIPRRQSLAREAQAALRQRPRLLAESREQFRLFGLQLELLPALQHRGRSDQWMFTQRAATDDVSLQLEYARNEPPSLQAIDIATPKQRIRFTKCGAVTLWLAAAQADAEILYTPDRAARFVSTKEMGVGLAVNIGTIECDETGFEVIAPWAYFSPNAQQAMTKTVGDVIEQLGVIPPPATD